MNEFAAVSLFIGGAATLAILMSILGFPMNLSTTTIPNTGKNLCENNSLVFDEWTIENNSLVFYCKEKPIQIKDNTILKIGGINKNGNMILCCNDYNSSVVFGNMKNKKIIDIWNSPIYKKTRKDLSEGIFGPEICKKCARNEVLQNVPDKI